ncbi:MAG: amidohydrolase family protein, partial [bacterium]
MPERNAADLFAPTEEALREERNAGFTTVGVAFDKGIFPGRVAAVNTGDARVVLKTPVAQQTMFGQRRGAYPVTLMGSIALVKQAFLDAQYAARTGKSTPPASAPPRYEFHPVARGLEAAATGALPVWFGASTQRELTRVVALASEMGVNNYVVVGAEEGWLAVDALKRAAKPVVVGLDFPAASSVTGRAFELRVAPVSGRDDARRAADSAVSRLEHRNAAALVRAGIPIALSGNGLAPSQFRDRVRQAIDAGLSADDALRALTTTPARLLGVDGAVGTIETGKIANLIVTQGELFTDGRLRHVFVDGVHYDVPNVAE